MAGKATRNKGRRGQQERGGSEMAELKQRKCKACKTPFTPARSTQTACGIDCAMQLAHEKKVKVVECD